MVLNKGFWKELQRVNIIMVVCRIISKFYTFFLKNVQEQQFFLWRSRVYHSLNTCKCLVFWWIWWQKLCHFLVYVHPIWKHLFVYVFFHYKAGSTFIFIHLNNEEEEVWPISIGISRAGGGHRLKKRLRGIIWKS